MSFWGWSGVALTHGSSYSSSDKHWTEDEKIMKELEEKRKKEECPTK